MEFASAGLLLYDIEDPLEDETIPRNAPRSKT